MDIVAGKRRIIMSVLMNTSSNHSIYCYTARAETSLRPTCALDWRSLHSDCLTNLFAVDFESPELLDRAEPMKVIGNNFGHQRLFSWLRNSRIVLWIYADPRRNLDMPFDR